MRAEDPDRIRLYLADHEGDLVAATTLVRVGRARLVLLRRVLDGQARRARLQRRAVADAARRDGAGATVYDLRGITDTLSEDDPHFGLIQFKLGTGGEAVEYLGEWDLPLNQLAVQGVRRSTWTGAGERPMTFTLYVDERALARAPAVGGRRRRRASCRSSRATATASATSGWPRRRHCSASTPSRSARPDELPAVQAAFPGDVLVLTPSYPRPDRRPDRPGRADRRAPGDAAGRRPARGSSSRR